jgi:hypothetical protein
MIERLSDKLKEKLSDYMEEDRFLNNPTKKDAINIAKKICEPNNKEAIIGGMLNKLLAFENRKTTGRDHVIHTVHTYLLGMIIIDALNGGRINKFTWKIASLFHDIGYESADYFSSISNIDKFTPEHGLFGSIITWDILHSEYLKGNPQRSINCIKKINGREINYSWNNLNEYILPACKAILLHNMPNSYYKTKLSYSDNNYAFLLIICDTLQEWSRPLNGNNQSSPVTSYSIDGPYTNEDYCELSIYFPEDVNVKEVENGLKEKCSCYVETKDTKLTVKWKYRN